MIKWIKQLDSILRGEATRIASIRQGTIDISARGLSIVLIILGLIYGLCMGLFSVIASSGKLYQQLFATMVKVPLLFFLTLLVTLPSLYVFNALVGSKLTARSVLRLLVAAMGVMMAVLASMGTIVAFFSVSTISYHFMVLLNVVVFTVCGLLAMSFLLQTLRRLSIAQEDTDAEKTPRPSPTPVESISESAAAEALAHGEPMPFPQKLETLSELRESFRSRRRPGPLDRDTDRILGPHVKIVFRIWIVVFALVGSQMGWVLRPFIGNPNSPFTWFRPRQSSFFEAVWHTLRGFLGA